MNLVLQNPNNEPTKNQLQLQRGLDAVCAK